MVTLKKAASAENLLLRLQDIPFALDQLEACNRTETHALFGRLDRKKIGMSGHSFGAVTTQGVSGQAFPLGLDYTESRICAALAMSPSMPKWAGEKRNPFTSVKVPWLLMTGTLDSSPIGDTTPASRLEVFPALPLGSKYELVLNGAEHSAFGDRSLPGERGTRNPAHHRSILATSTAFFDSTLRNDAAAKAWLDGEGVLSAIEKEDRWQRK
jgi:predicted dienelactone hydrolase